MSDTPKSCPFCGSYVALLDDGTHCGDSEGNWTAFRCLTSWHRWYHDPRKLQSKTCETVERHKLYDRIKRLEEAGDALYENSDPTKWDLPEANARKLKEQEAWYKAKEAKP